MPLGSDRGESLRRVRGWEAGERDSTLESASAQSALAHLAPGVDGVPVISQSIQTMFFFELLAMVETEERFGRRRRAETRSSRREKRERLLGSDDVDRIRRFTTWRHILDQFKQSGRHPSKAESSLRSVRAPNPRLSSNADGLLLAQSSICRLRGHTLSSSRSSTLTRPLARRCRSRHCTPPHRLSSRQRSTASSALSSLHSASRERSGRTSPLPEALTPPTPRPRSPSPSPPHAAPGPSPPALARLPHLPQPLFLPKRQPSTSVSGPSPSTGSITHTPALPCRPPRPPTPPPPPPVPRPPAPPTSGDLPLPASAPFNFVAPPQRLIARLRKPARRTCTGERSTSTASSVRRRARPRRSSPLWTTMMELSWGWSPFPGMSRPPRSSPSSLPRSSPSCSSGSFGAFLSRVFSFLGGNVRADVLVGGG